MNYYGKAQDAADKMLIAFEKGDIPKALANVFITGAADRHCAQWSWSNRLLVALNGYSDAMGFSQWKKIERHVKKGSKAFPILAPKIVTTINQENEKEKYCAGFLAVLVFGYEQTEGKPIKTNPELVKWLDNLPLRDVAESWGLKITAYNGNKNGALGYYMAGNDRSINLGVKQLATWAHELIHASDHRVQGELKCGQDIDQEIIAEFGGAVLLELIGEHQESDQGGCFEYINSYAKKAKIAPITAINRVLARTCEAVALILDTAKTLHQQTVEPQ